MAKRRQPSDPVIRYLRNIEAKLDRINKRLEKFLSAAKTKNKRAEDIPKRVKVFGLPQAAEKYRKEHPDDDVDIIITGVPRAGRGE
jgi:hypothetical protein